MRFGVIFPDALASWLLGIPDGWLIYRGLLASASLITIYLFFEKNGGTVSGLVATAIWWTSPITLRTLSTTYLDSTALSFMVIGALLLAWPRSKIWMSITAGVVWGLAASAHLYLIFCMVFLVPFIIGSRWSELTKLMISSLWAVGSCLLLWGIAWAYYRGVWGVYDMWALTKELMQGMAAGDTNLWKMPLGEAISKTPAWIGPILLGLAYPLVLSRKNNFIIGAWLSLLLSTAFFWLGDIVGGAYALSMPFYFSFLYPAIFLALASAFSEIISQFSDKYATACWKGIHCKQVFAGCLIGFLIFLNLITANLHGFRGIYAIYVLVGILFLWISCQWISMKNKKRIIVFMTVFTVVHTVIQGSGFFSQFLGAYRMIRGNEDWQPEMALELARVLPPAKVDGRVLKFWYDDSLPGSVRTLQSSQLHRFSMLLDSRGHALTFPNSEELSVTILYQGVEVIMLLDEDEGRLNEASKFLQSLLSNWMLVSKGVLQSKGKTIFYHIVEDDQRYNVYGAGGNALKWICTPDAAMINLGLEDRLLRSSRRRWMVEAFAEIPEFSADSNLKFEGRVICGRFDLMVLDAEDQILAVVPLWPTIHPLSRSLKVPGGRKNLRLALRNTMPKGSTSEIIIQKTSISLPN